nr:CatA-like O-acetyltransferase [Campylobacter blaseri]
MLIFTLDKYFKENDRYILPIFIQVHHVVCDEFHVARF